MARTINQINQQILDAIAAEPRLAGLTSESSVAIWRLFVYVCAVCWWSLENLFDLHTAENKALIAADKPHRLKWYAEKTLAYQFGDTLVPDQDYYDNSGLTDEEIEVRKPIKKAAAIEQEGGIRIKVAGLAGTELAPITSAQLAGLSAYFKSAAKDAGVFIDYTNGLPDSLRLGIRMYYDPQVLDETGKRLDGTNDTPVQQVIDDYLKTKIPFNSYFVGTDLIDLIQKVEGIEMPTITSQEARYGARPYEAFTDYYLPDAGYMRLPEGNLTLTFLPSPL